MVRFSLALHTTLKLFRLDFALNVVLQANRRKGDGNEEVGNSIKPRLKLLELGRSFLDAKLEKISGSEWPLCAAFAN